MAEILLRVHDKVGRTPELDVKCTKRGDVIFVAEDGWSWGHDELTLPFYRIIKFPGVTIDVFTPFLSSEPETNPVNPSNMRLRRFFKFDVDDPSLPADMQAHIADDTRAQPFFVSTMSGPQAYQLKKQRPSRVPVQDPVVIWPTTP